MKTKTLLASLAVITIISLLTTCKKYPENTLWFKSANSAFKSGNLTAFTVDGIDSIPMWNTFFNTPPYGGFAVPASNSPYDILTVFWRIDKGVIESGFGTGSYHFFNNSKDIYIYFRMYDDIYNHPQTYNIFYSAETTWKILKLTKSGTIRIQRTYNNKVYEMEFA